MNSVVFNAFKTRTYFVHTHTHRQKFNLLSPKCVQILKAALPNGFFSPWNLAKAEKHKSFTKKTKKQAARKTIQQIASLCQKNPTTPGDMSTKTPNVLLLLLQLWRLGQQMRNRGHWAWAVWRPICSTTQAAHSSRALGIHHPPPSVPRFSSLSSHCIPSETASSAKRAIFWMGRNTASCQVKFGHSLLVSTDRIWNPAPPIRQCCASALKDFDAVCR